MPKYVPPHVAPVPIAPAAARTADKAPTGSRGQTPLPRRLWSVTTIGQATELSRSKLYKVIAKGELKSLRVGDAIRITDDAYEEWLRHLEEEALEREPGMVEP